MVLGVVIPVALLAQAAAPPVYNVLSVYRETVKVGKGSAHDAHEVAWAGALVAAKNPTGFLAISAMTGPSENWYISPFATWADYEKSNKATEDTPALAAIQKRYSSMEGDYLTDGRMMILTSVPALNYGRRPISRRAGISASRGSRCVRVTTPNTRRAAQ